MARRRSIRFNRHELLERVDLLVLEHSSISLYTDRPHDARWLEERLLWLRQHSYIVRYVDCEGWQTQNDFFQHVRTTFRLRQCYLDRLSDFQDAVHGMSVPAQGGLVWLFLHFDSFAKREPEFCHSILDIMERYSRRLLVIGGRWIVMLQTKDPELRFSGIGGCSIQACPDLTQVDRLLHHKS